MGSTSVEEEASDCLRFLPADEAARNIASAEGARVAMGSDLLHALASGFLQSKQP